MLSETAFLFFLFFLFLVNKLYSLEQFQTHSKIQAESTELSHILLALYKHSLPIINLPHQMGHLLPLMNLHGQVIITQSPQFTLRFTLRLLLAMRLDKCTMACTHHYSIIQNIFTALKIPSVLPPHHSLPSTSQQPLIFLPSPQFCLFSNVIQQELYIHSLSRLATFTW